MIPLLGRIRKRIAPCAVPVHHADKIGIGDIRMIGIREREGVLNPGSHGTMYGLAVGTHWGRVGGITLHREDPLTKSQTTHPLDNLAP